MRDLIRTYSTSKQIHIDVFMRRAMVMSQACIRHLSTVDN